MMTTLTTQLGSSLCGCRKIDVAEKLAALAKHLSAAARDSPRTDFAARQRQRLQRIEQAAHRRDAVALRLPSDNELFQYRREPHALELGVQGEDMRRGDR